MRKHSQSYVVSENGYDEEEVKDEDNDEPNTKKNVEDDGGVETKENSVKLGKDAEHEKGYLSEGNDWGADEFVDFSETVLKILDTLTMKPNLFARSGKNDKRILSKLVDSKLGHN